MTINGYQSMTVLSLRNISSIKRDAIKQVESLVSQTCTTVIQYCGMNNILYKKLHTLFMYI